MINPDHHIKQIEYLHAQIVSDYARTLDTSSLGPHDIMFVCQRCWWPSLKISAPILSLPLGGRILDHFHVVLLPKLKSMKKNPLVIRDSPLE